ncbi:hypothetical protein MSAN_01106400 [Mycena sanguinolenta]|uniref:Protein kinase domain-containing protein n=1 Tax=Mycena sanguinolenta TaxID=230812 RepID=A0A8H7DA32_9AGAR|nr:hypothetical protein MSAN_01106400 [Mycena sanguinolenta]
MPSTRLSAESTPVEKPPQQRSVSARSDVHARREPDLGAKHGGDGWRTVNNYISGGQGGMGGNGLRGRGGAGGAGESPTLHYEINGEHIVVNTFKGSEPTPSDFLRIPLGNLDLRSEIRVDAASGAVWRHREQKGTSVRRMYSARVVGHSEPMTVALYQGHNAEEEWKRDLTRYSGLRHPHILQIYASASSSGMHAVVFHDDLIPYRQFVDSFRHSVILKACIIWYAAADWNSAYIYGTHNMPIQEQFFTNWIRRSTGRLCMEFHTEFHSATEYFPGPRERPPPQSILSLQDPNQESLIISSLGYPEWHSLCESYLYQYRSNYVSVRAEVTLGSIIHWPSGSRIEHAIEIASATEVQNEWSGWHRAMEEDDSAIRDVFGKALYLDKRISAAPWLAQANYIFSQLKINLNHEDFNLVNRVLFTLKIGKTAQNPPDGYLFLCSPKDFETGPTSFRWPDQPAYWSLNPSGSNPLSDEEAWRLGFPSITRRTRVDTVYWDETVYAGLRKFDECKGFDPESQDLAKELGHPLYELCVQTSVATSWGLPVDPEDESNYPSSYSEEEYSTEDEMESNSHLASSCVEVLTTDDENFLEEFSSDESDCSNSYPDDGVLEIESNQELTAENDDSLRELLSHDAVVGQQYLIGELAELVKFGLIVVLGLMTLYEYIRVLF